MNIRFKEYIFNIFNRIYSSNMLIKIYITLLTLATFSFMHEGLADRHIQKCPVYIKGLLKAPWETLHCVNKIQSSF